MAAKPGIPKGCRDFSSADLSKRSFIFKTISTIFQRYGFSPIETPAMENRETLMGKYGDEGDKLIFKILNSGNFLLNAAIPNATEEADARKFGLAISEKALRYDLTVPFARYVVQHHHELTFPFKRYQIQPVWRADRPQSGRYREFYQCDADVIGSVALVNEAELLQLIEDVFLALGLDTTTKLNNRKILAGIAQVMGASDKLEAFTVALDKLDKIGIEEVRKELFERGITPESIQKIEPLLLFEGNNVEKLAFLKSFLKDVEIGLEGIAEVESIFALLQCKQPTLDLTLARGLNYYTGAIIEVQANEGSLKSSIAGGGRYDDLTGIFGLKGLSGVGVSFGIDRIYDILQELKKFDHLKIAASPTQLMIAPFGSEELKYGVTLLSSIRAAGINAEIYPDVNKKVVKQFEYANKKEIPYVVVIGSEELTSGLLTLKQMATGQQEKLSLNEIIEKIRA